ncbi:MAG: hypothetical protein RI894_717 [Bacteroidota bacterium]|jgi:hypothetical protein
MLLPIWALAFMKYRFPVALTLLIGGILLTFGIGIEWSWLFWLPGLLLTLAHLFVGTSATASQLLQMGDVEGAEKMLNTTINPNWLISVFQANFFAIKGMIAMTKNDPAAAEVSMRMAAELGGNSAAESAGMLLSLGMAQMQQQKFKESDGNIKRAYDMGSLPEQEQGVALFYLTQLSLNKRDITSAKSYYAKLKASKNLHPDLAKHILELDKIMKQSAQLGNSTMHVRQQQNMHQKRR